MEYYLISIWDYHYCKCASVYSDFNIYLLHVISILRYANVVDSKLKIKVVVSSRNQTLFCRVFWLRYCVSIVVTCLRACMSLLSIIYHGKLYQALPRLNKFASKINNFMSCLGVSVPSTLKCFHNSQLKLSLPWLFWIHSKEFLTILQGGLIQANNLATSLTFYHVLIMFVTMTTFVMTGGTLTPRRVFTTLSLVGVITDPMLSLFERGIFQFSESRVGGSRIQVRLLSDGFLVDSGGVPSLRECVRPFCRAVKCVCVRLLWIADALLRPNYLITWKDHEL